VRAAESKLAALGEFGLIKRLNEILRETLAPGVRGGGDDCARLPLPADSKQQLILTTDTMVEVRHFDWKLTSAFDLGWKVLAVNLSDLAAAGAKPAGALVTAQLRSDIDPATVEEVYRGIVALAKKCSVSVAGGDTVRSSECAFGITAVGFCARSLTRADVRPGDEIWVSGEIGAGGLGLSLARGEIKVSDFPDGGVSVRERYLRPEPRIDLGLGLAEAGLATAAIDISDGLFQDAEHLASQSLVDIEINLESIPLAATSLKNWSALRAGTAGDDYELLFCAPESNREKVLKLGERLKLPLHCIGKAFPPSEADRGSVKVRSKEGSGLPVGEVLLRAGLSGGGYDHFR